MHIRDKIYMDRSGLVENGPITIVAFGDSVTHGALLDEINYETVYWELLRKKILGVRNYVPVNVINAGIGGITAKDSLKRLDQQVLKHSPDLVIVCFGLNDVNGEVEEFCGALREIFTKCKNSGADVIFMTPNMLNTSVSEDAPAQYYEYAKTTAGYQNGGRMDLFMDSAKDVAKECGVTICDCYGKWKKLSESQDITKLLINKINHPTPEMHKLFADSLFDIIMGEGEEKEAAIESTMYDKL